MTEARDRGWDRLSNGDLLDAAEAAGFEVLVTADMNIRYQQNLSGRRIAIVELGTPRWFSVLRHVENGVAAVGATAGRWRVNAILVELKTMEPTVTERLTLIGGLDERAGKLGGMAHELGAKALSLV